MMYNSADVYLGGDGRGVRDPHYRGAGVRHAGDRDGLQQHAGAGALGLQGGAA